MTSTMTRHHGVIYGQADEIKDDSDTSLLYLCLIQNFLAILSVGIYSCGEVVGFSIGITTVT